MPSLIDVPGFSVGHSHDLDACTGCTVVLCPEEGATAAAVVRGLASGTRQMGIADPVHLVDRVNAVVLAGGSAFGLDCAGGVMRYLREAGRGFSTVHARIPIVPTAILYDVGLGDSEAFPTPEMAFQACSKASSEGFAEGAVGVGAGATVGKLLSVRCATKGGVGSWSITTDDGVTVGALVAVNAFGDVYEPASQSIIAGARRSPESRELINMVRLIKAGKMPRSFGGGNTTLAIVATNAKLEPRELRRVASWAADGLVSVLRPAFTAVDGDVLIALSSETAVCEQHQVGLLAQEALGRAVIRAVQEATSLGGLPAASELESLRVV